jgi:hypothetical protein
MDGSRPSKHQDPAFWDMWRQRSESMPEISESWNGPRPWEHQDPSLLGAERRQAKGNTASGVVTAVATSTSLPIR